LFVDKNDAEGRIQCISGISETFNLERDPQSYLRLITALGNLCYGDQEARELVDALGIKIDISKIEGGDDKTLQRIKDIAKELKL
jgi:hypothetical protein